MNRKATRLDRVQPTVIGSPPRSFPLRRDGFGPQFAVLNRPLVLPPVSTPASGLVADKPRCRTKCPIRYAFRRITHTLPTMPPPPIASGERSCRSIVSSSSFEPVSFLGKSTASCPAISGRRAPVQRNTPLSIRQQRTSEGAFLDLGQSEIGHSDESTFPCRTTSSSVRIVSSSGVLGSGQCTR